MATLEITVPEAGKSQSFAMTGLSLLVLAAPSYQSIAGAAKVSLNQPGDGFPIVPGNALPSDAGKFQRIYVTGTDASAGDQVTLMSLNTCLSPVINAYGESLSKAYAGNTFKKVMDGTVQQLSDLEIIDSTGTLPASVYIAASGGNINYRWNDGTGTDPAVAGTDFVLIDGAEPVEILGLDFIQKLRFINSVDAETPALIIEARY